MIEQYKINTFDDLCSLIQKIQEKENVTLWYRGHTNDTWEIIPSIQRSNLASKERIITHLFYHSATQISNDNNILYKIIIPSNKIDYFKNIIKTVGITDSYIFPDLEHIAKDVLDRHSN